MRTHVASNQTLSPPIRWLALAGCIVSLFGSVLFFALLSFPAATVCIESGCSTVTGSMYFFQIDGNGELKTALLVVASLVSVPAFIFLGTPWGRIVWLQKYRTYDKTHEERSRE